MSTDEENYLPYLLTGIIIWALVIYIWRHSIETVISLWGYLQYLSWIIIAVIACNDDYQVRVIETWVRVLRWRIG